jgi:hypothetical protein
MAKYNELVVQVSDASTNPTGKSSNTEIDSS